MVAYGKVSSDRKENVVKKFESSKHLQSVQEEGWDLDIQML